MPIPYSSSDVLYLLPSSSQRSTALRPPISSEPTIEDGYSASGRIGPVEVGTRTGWNKLNSGSILSAPSLSVAGDIGFDHISFSSHVSNDVVTKWGDIMGWENDLGEIFGMGSFGTEVHLGTDDTLPTSGRRSVENETAPSPASAESVISSHMDIQYSFPEDLQNGFELGNPNLWMTETDSKLEMNIDPAGLEMMELLAGLPT